MFIQSILYEVNKTLRTKLKLLLLPIYSFHPPPHSLYTTNITLFIKVVLIYFKTILYIHKYSYVNNNIILFYVIFLLTLFLYSLYFYLHFFSLIFMVWDLPMLICLISFTCFTIFLPLYLPHFYQFWLLPIFKILHKCYTTHYYVSLCTCVKSF